jgi:hypothetical protein
MPPISASSSWRRNANTGASTLATCRRSPSKAIKRPNGDALVANDILASARVRRGIRRDELHPAERRLECDQLQPAHNPRRHHHAGATKPQRVALGATGQGLISNGTDALWGMPALRGYLFGLTLSRRGDQARSASRRASPPIQPASP